ncbi:uncharacterized protein DS421_14g462770 [Arachis hypogaea]|nr:uncharacterized protein DS421_14g462770 [Arachis hypogaea]
MEFNSSCDQTNFMGYYPPSLIDYSNGGWEYHQEITDSEHSNQWRYALEPQDEQDNFMGYCPPSQYDSSHYLNDDWEYHQEMIDDQAIHMRYDPESQDDLCHYPHGVWTCQQECEQSVEMGHFPETQYDPDFDESNNYSYCGWEDQNQRDLGDPYFVHQETSSLECTFKKFMQDCPPMPQDDLYCDEFHNSSSCDWEDQNQRAFNVPYSIKQEPSSLEQTFNSFMQNCPASPPSFSCENSSSLNDTSTQSFRHDPYQPQNSFHNPQNSFHVPQNITTTHPYPQNYSQPSSLELAFEQYLQTYIDSWKEQETLCNKMDGYLE